MDHMRCSTQGQILHSLFFSALICESPYSSLFTCGLVAFLLWFSYFSVAVIKYHHQKQHPDESIYFGLWLQISKSPSWWRSMAASSRSRKQKCLIFICKYGAERVNWQWREAISSQILSTVIHFIQQVCDTSTYVISFNCVTKQGPGV